MATSTTKKNVTFIAHCENQRLVLTPGMDPQEALKRGVNGGQAQVGRNVEFSNHVLVVDDADLIEELRSHRLNGTAFIEQGADEPKPTVSQQFSVIAQAAAQADPDGIKAVLDAERETHNRSAVLEAGETALEALAGDEDGEAESSPAQLTATSKRTSTRSQD